MLLKTLIQWSSRRVRSLAMSGLSLCLTATAFAAPPDVKGVFPLGAAVGSTVEITTSGALGQKGTQVWANEPGLSFEIPEMGTTCKVTVAADATPGLRWLRFYNSDGAAPLVPFVIGTLPEVSETEPNNSLDKVQKLERSAVINGKLAEAGDVDCFAVPMEAGQTLVAAIDANWRLGQPVDAILQVLNPDGVIVEQNDDDQGNDPLISARADRAGLWIVRVFGFPAAPDSSIRFAGGANFKYRLTLTTGAFGNHAVPSVTKPGAPSPVKVVGWNIAPEVRDQQAEPRSSFLAVPQLPNTVPFEPFAGPLVVEPEADDNAHQPEIAIGGVACGVIGQPGDEDQYSFKAMKGQKLEFDVESRSLGFPLDAALRIKSVDQAVLVESDDGPGKDADPFLKWTVPADGEYRVSIRDVFKNGGWRFAYRLWVRTTEPKVAISVKADVLTVAPDKTVEIPVTVTRTDGYAKELDISVTGLPPGLTADVMKSGAKGDTAAAVKLTLKAAADAAAWNGTLQIQAKSVGDDAPPLVATFAIPNTRATTDKVWLTVTAAEKK